MVPVKLLTGATVACALVTGALVTDSLVKNSLVNSFVLLAAWALIMACATVTGTPETGVLVACATLT